MPVNYEKMFFLFNEKYVPIKILRHKTAKRIIVRIIPNDFIIAITIPYGTTLRQLRNFIENHKNWISDRLSKVKKCNFVKDLKSIPVLGIDRTIIVDDAVKTGAILEPQYLRCAPLQLNVQIKSFLLCFSHSFFLTWCDYYANILGVSYSRLVLKEPKTMWGSCSNRGRIMFNWRLIMAPDFVGKYVVCHEVTHLEHMHHGPNFWRTVENIFPEHKNARNWLKNNGTDLYYYKFEC